MRSATAPVVPEEASGPTPPQSSSPSPSVEARRILYGMTTTARLEMRVPPEQAELIRQAAAARGESVTGFVLEAATKAAEEELAVARETLVPPEFFARLLAALDAPDESSPRLAALARSPRVSERA